MLDVLVILLRLAQYGGAVVLLGTPLFLLYGLRGSDAVALGWTRSLLVSAAAVVAIGSAAAFAAQTAVMAGSLTEGLKPATLGFMLTGTSLGPAFLVRTLAALLALLALIQDKPSRGLWGFFAVAGLIVGASFAWTGQRRGHRRRGALCPSDGRDPAQLGGGGVARCARSPADPDVAAAVRNGRWR